MLESLIIENIVLVQKASLEFTGGLCVLTGETGAGKSIVLNSILTLVGREVKSKSLIRQGCKYGSIEGVFNALPEDAEAVLLENAITPTKELKIKCIIQAEGGIRYFINNEAASQVIVKQIGEILIEVNRQHEQTFLMDEKNHIKILDEYSQNEAVIESLAEKYREVQLCEREIQETIARNKQIAFEIDYLRDVFNQLKTAEISEKEFEELQEVRIQNKKKFNTFETLKSASSKLEGASVGQVLMNIHRMISPIATDGIDDLSQTIDRICIDIQEVEAVISSLMEKNYINTAEIDQAEERFFFLQDLARKFKIPPTELFQYQSEIERKIQNFDKTEESVVSLNKKKAILEKEYTTIAMELRTKRTAAAEMLSESINAALASLQMEGATFRVQIEETKMKKNGMDSIIFMIETNKNMGFGKLSIIASGGEVSRIVLAIKAAIAHLKQTPCVIFDEIDTGISGKTSNAVGEVMLRLAQKTQVIIITHQPQVAAKAHDHFRIHKTTSQNETETVVEKLETNDRVQEIARLLSGEHITPEALSNAKRLLCV